MKKIRVGVIGVGSMGRHHARVYSGMEEVELVGVADINKRAVAEVAAKYYTEAFGDCERLLKSDLDAVTIAVPTSMHKEIALKAADHGVHMLVEKPIADFLSSADAIIYAVRRENLKLMIGHTERFNPAIIKLKELITAGELGHVLSISCRRVGPYPPRIKDVGIITDLAVHDIDVVSLLYGERAMSVYAIGGNSIHTNKEDHASIILRYDDNKSGLVETNWLTPHKIRKITVTGTEGVADADYLEQSLRICGEEGMRKVKIEKREPLKNELEHFLDIVANDEEPRPSGIEGKYILLVALSATKSYISRKSILLDA
jgi:UDP-N-acetylglucosamine 3-dehydrogenase